MLDPREHGHQAANRATAAAERKVPGFASRAEVMILSRLICGPTSGEDLTDHCREQGLQFKDGRALGSVFAHMRRRGLIAVHGHCARRTGHGTAGGIVWRLAE